MLVEVQVLSFVAAVTMQKSQQKVLYSMFALLVKVQVLSFVAAVMMQKLQQRVLYSMTSW
jgi:hypothetical protein